MSKCFAVAALMMFSQLCSAQDKYRYNIDIKNIQSDKVSVTLHTPAVTGDNVVYSFARVIPGSYSEKSFGKYIDDFTAFDQKGVKLKIKKLNRNQYEIKGASKLSKITYQVNDTWDTPDKEFVFQPGGSNIDAGVNVVMNNHAFFGYFEGKNDLPVEVQVTKPANLYASTHLSVDRKSAEQDVLYAPNFVYLADNPVIYCVPDTTSFAIGKSRINISVFSETGKIKSNQLSAYLQPMGNALLGFFGQLPVDSYQFLFYFADPEKALTDRDAGGGGYGALEHSYSSLYFLPETSYEPQLKSMVNDVTSHEFLHILTPLNLHSQHIEKFNFTNPTMSKHLWLYEGVTEYFSNLVQLQSGIITEKTFFGNMRDKINESIEYGDFSMTEMSEKVLEEKFQKKYSSVYNRGALIAFLLDIHIREATQHSKDLKSVVVDLAGKYGPGKPFDDDQFLSEFVAASHPSVQGFIDKYIAGDQSLPYLEYFAKAGYAFFPVHRMDIFMIGRMGIRYDEEGKKFIFSEVEKNALGIKDDDVFISIDTLTVADDNIDFIWENYFMQNTTRKSMKMEVLRGGEKLVLEGPLSPGYREAKNYLAPKENLNANEQSMLEKLKKG